MAENRRLVLGISGGIAAYKTPELLRRFQRRGWRVGVALTPAATNFVSPLVLRTLADHLVLTDVRGEESAGIDHVELADWADVLVVAPATAQTLARLAGGFADEPVSLTFLATRAPRLVFPAMNVNMWLAPATQRNVERLRADGVTVVDPEEGELACGWQGAGRLPELDRIVEWTEAALVPKDLAGVRVVITAGPTREHLDPVRFLSNPSTGKMGFALARWAWRRGARVHLVAGPTHLPTPEGVERIDVVSAAEMYAATERLFEAGPVDLFVATAAVADYTPAQRSEHKHKKGDGALRLELERTRDILAEMVRRFRPRVRVGFAAETRDVVNYARRKLREKDLDLVVANQVGGGDGGFADDRNKVWLIPRTGETVHLPLQSKETIAARILDAVVPLLRERAAAEAAAE